MYKEFIRKELYNYYENINRKIGHLKSEFKVDFFIESLDYLHNKYILLKLIDSVIEFTGVSPIKIKGVNSSLTNKQKIAQELIMYYSKYYKIDIKEVLTLLNLDRCIYYTRYIELKEPTKFKDFLIFLKTKFYE
jgi:hypothetical protein